ncbi:MAG: gliding motility-associated C-terminal domain-containing protein, partial [Bacteroidia bacterium]|nr:gliding motility-associated C-terminal domain-containing protein [Bacteroidia bacterium]
AGSSVTLSGSGAVSYTWDNGVTDGLSFTPVATLTYIVTGTDVNGCTNTDTVLITVNSLPAVNAGIDQTVCEGTSVTLSGSGAVSYTWNNGITNGVAFTPVATLTYTVTGTDVNSCTNTDAVLVTVNSLPAANAGIDLTVCAGTSVILSGSGAVSYTWDNGVTDVVAFTPTATTTYTVTGTDAIGCMDTDDVTVTVNPLPNADAGNDTTVVFGTGVSLTASGGGTYLWNTADTTATIFVYATDTTPYYVTVTLNGCSDVDSVTVNIINLYAEAGPDTFICAGNIITLHGQGGGGYIWYVGTDTLYSQDIIVSPLLTTEYFLCVTTGAICIMDSITVTVNPLPAVNLGADQIACSDSTITLDAGVGFNTYTWSTGGTNQTINIITSGTYSVTVTDTANCTATDTVMLIVYPVPQINAVTTGISCYSNGDGSIDLTISNGTAPYLFQWNSGSTTEDLSALVPGIYIVNVTDVNNCSAVDSASITSPEQLLLSYTITDESCVDVSDGRIDLNVTGGTPAYSYLWGNGSTSGNLSGISAGTYSVSVFDANNCTTERNFEIIAITDTCNQVPGWFIPNVFSPNNDGLNDILYVRGSAIRKIELVIYDRWGQKIFETTSLDKGWDGRFRGKELAPAVFVWNVHILFFDGSEVTEHGNITIIK